MGRETAIIHLGIKLATKDILRHTRSQKGTWLHEASQAMLQTVLADWKAWKKEGYE